MATELQASCEVAVRDAPVVEGTRKSLRRRNSNRVRRKLAIGTSLEQNIHKCNQQADSPLWSLLPLEIRYLIWEFTASQYEDLSRPFPDNCRQLRPGHRGPLKSCYSILLTCRRAWLEANSLPMKQAVHHFWYDFKEHELTYDKTRGSWWWWRDFSLPLTRLNLDNICGLHFMLPVDKAKIILGNSQGLRRVVKHLKPKTVKITNRYGDWDWHRWIYDDGTVKRTVNDIALLLEACAAYVGKFQLALEAPDTDEEWKQYAAFFDFTRRLKARIGIETEPGTDIPWEVYFGVVDEPHSWRWTRRPFQYNDEEPDPQAPDLKLRVLELEWVRIRRAIDPSKDESIKIPADPAPNNPYLPRSHRSSHKTRGYAYSAEMDPLLCQQDRLRQHSQKLSEAHAAQWRKTFYKVREEAEIGNELERICASGSLLYIKD